MTLNQLHKEIKKQAGDHHCSVTMGSIQPENSKWHETKPKSYIEYCGFISLDGEDFVIANFKKTCEEVLEDIKTQMEAK